MSKVGRNDPCPCGSGKKYKKCCLNRLTTDPAKSHVILVNRLLEWVLGQPDSKGEFERFSRECVRDGPLTEIEFDGLTDAFVFEHKLPDGRTPFEHFLASTSISPDEIYAYQELGSGPFSMFEVLEVYEGLRLKLKDMICDKEYTVKENRGTYQIEPGNIMVCRLGRYNSHYVVVTGLPHVWYGEEATYFFKRELKQLRSKVQEQGMDAASFLKIIFRTRDEPETLDGIKKALKRKLVSLGIGLNFRDLGRRINKNKDIHEAFPEVFGFDYPSNDDFKETTELLRLLWNKYPRKSLGDASFDESGTIGPKELMLIQDLMDQTMSNVPPTDRPSIEERDRAVEEFRKRWLETPQKELGGKIPWAVILEERRKRGNPSKEFTVRVEYRETLNFDMNKADNLYFEGVRTFKQGALGKAVEYYREAVEAWPEHYKAWGNLGVCLAYLGNKEEGIECLKNALSIEPSYELARTNLEYVEKRTVDELTAMAVLAAITALKHKTGKKGRRQEEFDVWTEIDEEIRKVEKKGR